MNGKQISSPALMRAMESGQCPDCRQPVRSIVTVNVGPDRHARTLASARIDHLLGCALTGQLNPRALRARQGDGNDDDYE